MKWYEIEKNKLPSISSIASEIEPFYNEPFIVNGVLNSTYDILNNLKGYGSPDSIIEEIKKDYSIKSNMALEIGTATHSMIENAIKETANNVIDVKGLTSELSNTVKGLNNELLNTAKGWNSFLRGRKVDFIFNELPVYCDKFAGRLDLLTRIHNAYMIMDIKTTNFKDNQVFLSRSHMLQLTMYYMAIKYIVKNNIMKYKIKDLKYNTDYEVDLTLYKNMLEQFIRRPHIAILYLDKSSGRYAFFRFGKTEIIACQRHIRAYLHYTKIAKTTKDITRRSRYVKLKTPEIETINGETYIKLLYIKDFLKTEGLYRWQNKNSYYVYLKRFFTYFKYEGKKYVRETDFYKLVDYLKKRKEKEIICIY